MAIGADHVHAAGTVRRRQREFVPPSELYPVETRADTALMDQLFYATVDECPDPHCRRCSSTASHTMCGRHANWSPGHVSSLRRRTASFPRSSWTNKRRRILFSVPLPPSADLPRRTTTQRRSTPFTTHAQPHSSGKRRTPPSPWSTDSRCGERTSSTSDLPSTPRRSAGSPKDHLIATDPAPLPPTATRLWPTPSRPSAVCCAPVGRQRFTAGYAAQKAGFAWPHGVRVRHGQDTDRSADG
jgi:hypothetical protein